ncbi:hypothetical protein A8B78_05315 [Jannaschia sp. EhC01]|nr:hypothetical protein A8B78_05315 [Jannaschia sp. EhC01]
MALTPVVASAQSHSGIIFSPLPITGGVAQNPTGGTQWIPQPLPGGHTVPVQGHDCGAAHAYYWIGQNITHAPVPANVRVIWPHTVVTYDYRPDRLNLATDDRGTVLRAYCG